MTVRIALMLAMCGVLVPSLVYALTVTSPSAGNVVITRAGDDYAAAQLSNPWDMTNADDVQSEHSSHLTDVTFVGGRFSMDTTGNDPTFYVLWPGFVSAVPMANGALYPISTSRYRHVTMKIRETAASGSPLLSQQPVMLYYMVDTLFQPGGQLGHTQPIYIDPGVWQIVHFDMLTDTASPFTWTTSPVIRGLRVDPTANPNVHVEVDWIHLSAPANSAAESFLVTWSDSASGPYTVTAVDPDGARFELGSDISGSQYLADFSLLPPGEYSVEVARSGASDESPGQVTINAAPLIAPLQPDARGDTAHSFAVNVSGNAWGPIESTDIWDTNNLVNVSYSNPIGSLSARPTSSDSIVYFNTYGSAASTDLYRSLCFTLQVMGPSQVGVGSVARLVWGPSPMTVSQDIVVHEGLNEYCFANMDMVPIEPDESTGQWNGTVSIVRLDPHEFSVSSACVNSPSPVTCRDIRIDSLSLSPYHSADPGFTFRWQLEDSDHANATVRVFLDPDHIINGNEISVGQSVAANGFGALVWMAPSSLALGTYNVLFSSDDGINQVMHYAPGPLKVMSVLTDIIFVNGFD